MKKLVFMISLVFSLLGMTLIGFAAPTEAEKQKYGEAIEANLTEMLKGSIALDKGSADNKTYLLNWLLAETQPKDAKKIVEKIEKLDAQMEANATNSVKLKELIEEKEKVEAQLEEKMDRWVYLNDLNERILNGDE